MKKYFIFLIVILSTPLIAQQHVTWKTRTFGYYCCNQATWVINIFPGQNGKLYIVQRTQSDVPMFSTDNGISWKQVKKPPFPKAYYLLTYASCPDQKLIAATRNTNPNRYSAWLSDSGHDTSKSWIEVASGLPVGSPLVKYAVDSSSNIFASTNSNNSSPSFRVYYLANGDTNWIPRSNGLPDSIRINSLVMNGYNTIFAATENHGLFQSTDRGNNWNKISSSKLPGSQIQSVIVNKKGNIFTATEFGVFISKDNGENWDSINTGLPARGISSFAFNKANTLFAYSGDSQIYYLPEFTNTWEILTDSLKMEHFLGSSTLAINSNDYLYVLDANLLHYSANPVTGLNNEKNELEKIPAEFKLLQNYPNPFNPVTTISYSIPQHSFVELKVYDMLGREVAALINKEQNTGKYKVQFDGSGLPSGIYIYTIHAGQFRDSKKLLLLK